MENNLIQSSVNDFKNAVFKVNQISFQGSNVQICLQSENGPCPLIAIVNVLSLQKKKSIGNDSDIDFVTGDQMVNNVADYLMNLNEDVHDLDVILHHFEELQTGLIVDVRFSNVTDFQDDTNLYIFKRLNIKLYHGWLMDPQITPEYEKLRSYSYDQLAAELVKDTDDILQPTTKKFLEEFLGSSQLTYHGLCQLNATMMEGELAVLFQNNHFSVIYKNGHVYSLCSDIGYSGAQGAVWQLLNDTSGDTEFVNDKFEPQNDYNNKTSSVDSDYELAQRLAIVDDFEIAMALQEEEEVQGYDRSGHSSPSASASRPAPRMPVDHHIPVPDPKKDTSCTLI